MIPILGHRSRCCEGTTRRGWLRVGGVGTLGLGLSIPLIVCGSQVIVAVMERFPVIVYCGAGLIAWTAGEMLQQDRLMAYYASLIPAWLLPVVVTAGVVGLGYWYNKYHKASATDVAHHSPE